MDGLMAAVLREDGIVRVSFDFIQRREAMLRHWLPDRTVAVVCGFDRHRRGGGDDKHLAMLLAQSSTRYIGDRLPVHYAAIVVRSSSFYELYFCY